MAQVYGYARASTKEQVETLLVQEKELARYFEYRYKDDPAGYAWGGQYTDRGVSGSVPLGNRPEGKKLVTGLQQGDVIVVTKLDRMFRSFRDLAEKLEFFREKGVRLIMLDLNVDTGTPVGQMLAAILGAVAQFERDRIRERTLEALRSVKSRGAPVNQEAPYGYRKGKLPGGKRAFFRDPVQRRWGSLFLELIDNRGWSVKEVWLEGCRRKWRKKNGEEFGERIIKSWSDGERSLRKAEEEEAGKLNGKGNDGANAVE